jgi:hypothetical protein
MDIDEISARLAIQEALARYCRGVDRGDAALIESAYHPDALDIHGSFRGTPAEFAALCIEKFDAAKNIVGQHHVTNSVMDIAGEEARVESYFLAWRPQANAVTGDPEIVPLGGRYLDRFEKRGNEWRIARRETIFDWLGKAAAYGAFEWSHDYPKGARREADPSTAFMAGL